MRRARPGWLHAGRSRQRRARARISTDLIRPDGTSGCQERCARLSASWTLGATFGQALRTLAMPGILLAGVGATAGLIGAVAAVPLIRHFVWGVRVSDPITYAGVVLLLLAVATVASVTPALRILRLDPATTLRQE